MRKPSVFISYSHKDEGWKDRLVSHLGVLQHENILDMWDDRRIGASEDWLQKIQEAIDAASVAILLVSADFLTSKFILGEEVPRIMERREKEGLRIFPVIIRPCAWKQVKWLTRMNLRPRDGRPILGGSDFQIETDLAAIAEEVAGIIESTSKVAQVESHVPLGPDKISLAKLPSINPELFGREREIAMLDVAWANPKINIVTLVGWGGVGKTALVNTWLRRMRADNFRGAERVFGWSFYSQGASEGKPASADVFIATALRWFGDPKPEEGTPWDKGERLAEYVKKQKTLLILDGLEPLQHPFHEQEGNIRDPGLQSLVRELAHYNPGLCIITTRLDVDDIRDFVGTAVENVHLENLSDEAGMELLKYLGVKGTGDEIRQAVRDFNGHALTLMLLGNYLSTVYGGDVQKRDRIAKLMKEKKYGGRAIQVVESYETWFKDQPELDILRMMGLFDRPAEGGAIEVLRANPPIKGLTSKLKDLSKKDWRFALNNLRIAGLLAKEDPSVPDTLDSHPLIKEHFGEKLKEDNPEAWKEAHSRLYEYYKTLAKEYPDNIEEMMPLYAAVVHGCEAGRFQETFEDVYWRRILRGNEFFNTQKLGAFSLDLGSLYYFFDIPWSQTVLKETAKGFVLNQVGLDLMAVGRIVEATEPLQVSLEAAITQQDWISAAVRASNLSNLYLTTGNLARALDYAQQGIYLAERSGNYFQSLINRITLADALHHAGRISEAEAIFREAEEMQKKDQPEYSYFYSLGGFQYCDLLLSQGKYQDVQKKVSQTIEIAKEQRWLLNIALDNLSIGRAHFLQAIHEKKYDFNRAAEHLNLAVDGLRRAGQQQYMPHGLLSRSELYIVRREFDKAQRDLNEAMTIAERGGMGLHQADCYLGYARLYLAMGDKGKARESLATAREMIVKMSYHLRDDELAVLESDIVGKFRDWTDVIYGLLVENGKVSSTDLPGASRKERRYALTEYMSSHSELDLEYSEQSESLYFRNIDDIKKQKNLWDEAIAAIQKKDEKAFINSVVQNVRYICNYLGFSLHTEEQYKTNFGRLSTFMVDATTVFYNLPINSTIPLLFLQGSELLENDLDDLRHILGKVLLHPWRIVFLILFVQADQSIKARRFLDEKFRKGYAYDVFVFDYERMQAIIGSKDPKSALRRIILSEINLVSISPYTTTGPTPENMFFGRESELREITEHVDCKSYAIIGGRRMGKTSVLRRLHLKYLPDAGFYTLYHDCSTTSSNEAFLKAAINDWSPEPPPNAPITFKDLLQSSLKHKPIVLLLDEADKLVANDRTNNWAIFNSLRALANSGHVQVILSGERTLRGALLDSSSPLFNFTNEMLIGRLNFPSVELLVTQPMKQLGIDIKDTVMVVQRIWDFTSGHPNIVQRLCDRLIKQINERGERQITLDDVEEVIEDSDFIRLDFLATYFSRASVLEQLCTLLMADNDDLHTLQAIFQALVKQKIDVTLNQVDDALERLVDLRNILKRTSDGWFFAVTAIPLVVSKLRRLDDFIALRREIYLRAGDIEPETAPSEFRGRLW